MGGVTIADFILARIAEDEAAARAATGGPWAWHMACDLHNDSAGWIGAPGASTASGVFVASVSDTVEGLDDGPHIATHDPARVLRQCEAFRRIAERHSQIETAILEDHGGQDEVTYCGHCGTDLDEGDCPDLMDLAAIWADHPDYQEEWKP